MTAPDKRNESPGDLPGRKPSPSEPSGRAGKKLLWGGLIVAVLIVGLGVLVWLESGQDKAGQDPSAQSSIPIEEALDDTPAAEAFSPDTVLATVNSEKIRLADVESLLKTIPESQRKAYSRDKQALLESVITQTLLLQEAKRLNVAGGASSPNPENATAQEKIRNERINALLEQEVLNDIQVQESELRNFYEQNKEQIPEESSFEDVQAQLRPYVLQMKQRQAVNDYIGRLMSKASINRNQDWIESQKAAAADNPLTRALETGRPGPAVSAQRPSRGLHPGSGLRHSFRIVHLRLHRPHPGRDHCSGENRHRGEHDSALCPGTLPAHRPGRELHGPGSEGPGPQRPAVRRDVVQAFGRGAHRLSGRLLCGQALSRSVKPHGRKVMKEEYTQIHLSQERIDFIFQKSGPRCSTAAIPVAGPRSFGPGLAFFHRQQLWKKNSSYRTGPKRIFRLDTMRLVNVVFAHSLNQRSRRAGS